MAREDLEDFRLAGRLVHWGLRTSARPSQEEEYQRLLDRYETDQSFAEAVRALANGLGLSVLSTSEHGLILGAQGDSPFAYPNREFKSVAKADDRLLDGLIQVAIAASVFPRSVDLQEDGPIARPPVTIEEVEELLSTLSRRYQETTVGALDPQTSDIEAGLSEAWRVYQAKVNARETADGRMAPLTVRRVIQANLERLVGLDCFRKEPGEKESYRPTWRYSVLVRELMATTLYQRVCTTLQVTARGE